MEEKVIIAHDMGSSGDKAIAVSVRGEIIAEVKKDYSMSHPQPTWAEQDPGDLWRAVCDTSREVIKKGSIRKDRIAGVVFSSMTQCLVAVDREGEPVRPLISWLDGRSAGIMAEKLWTPPRLMGYNIFRLIRFLRITGGSPGQTGKDQIGKILWLRQHEPENFNRAATFMDAKDFILMKLTGSRVTSADLAYIWWMMDSRRNRNRWHPALCRLAGLNESRLPAIHASADIIGHVTGPAARESGLPEGTPVINGAGDLAAAGLGSGCLEEGEYHICVGTSGWVAGHVRKRKIDIPHYTGCIGSARPDTYYLAMAHQETAGICLEWLKNRFLYHKDQLLKEHHTLEIYQILDKMAEKVAPGAEGLIFTPWMYGERCPLDDEFVRAGLYNLGLNHSREHLVRALFEGVALNTRWALHTLEHLYFPVTQLNIIGGGARSDIWCQIMADVTNRTIRRVRDPQQAGARGVALLASLTLGYIASFQEMSRLITIDRTFSPNPENRRLYDRIFREFKNIYRQNRRWYKRMNTSEGEQE